MSQQEAFIQIPSNLDGIEEASEKVLSPDDPREQEILSDWKRDIKKLRIRNEYFRRLRNGEKGIDIKRDLAETHYGNADSFYWKVHNIIYNWKKDQQEGEENTEEST